MYDEMKKMPLLESRGSEPIFVCQNFPTIDSLTCVTVDSPSRPHIVSVKRISKEGVIKLRVKLGLADDVPLYLVLVVPEGHARPNVPFDMVGIQWYMCCIPSPLVHANKRRLRSFHYVDGGFRSFSDLELPSSDFHVLSK